MFLEGDIGGYPIQQYRVENQRNTDTAFMIGHAYLTLYPSYVFVISSMKTPEINLSLHKKMWDLESIGTTIKKPGYWMSYPFHLRVTVRNCVFIYHLVQSLPNIDLH